MQLRFYKIPAHDTGSFAEELNAFLRGHRILNVEREFCHEVGGAYWAVCVEYLVAGFVAALQPANGKEAAPTP